MANLGICRKFAIASQRTEKRGTRSVNHVGEEEEYCLCQSTPPLIVTLKFEDFPVEMETDTGAALSSVTETTFEKLLKEKQALAPSPV